MNITLRKTTASLLAACVLGGALTVPAYAHGAFHHNETHHGWTTIDGKQYYYKNDGSCATKSTTINGVRYTFDKTGACTGKYTGWVKSGGKRFYYSDGEKQYGWVHTGKDGTGSWYYVDKKQGMLTGEQKIDGAKYTFSAKGKWDCDTQVEINGKIRSTYSLYENKRLDPKNYGGIYYYDGMAVVMSVNGQAEKDIEKFYPGMPGIMYREAKYSKYEMDQIRDYLEKNNVKGKTVTLCYAHYIDVSKNKLVIETGDAQMEKLLEYVNSLPNKDCVEIICGPVSEATIDEREIAKPGTWGVSMEVKDAADTGLVLVIKQGEGKRTGETMTGEFFAIQAGENGKWKNLPYIRGDVVWTDVGWLISEAEAESLEWPQNWEGLYGKLPAGHYRILKEITDFRGGGDYDRKWFAAEFDIK